MSDRWLNTDDKSRDVDWNLYMPGYLSSSVIFTAELIRLRFRPAATIHLSAPYKSGSPRKNLPTAMDPGLITDLARTIRHRVVQRVERQSRSPLALADVYRS